LALCFDIRPTSFAPPNPALKYWTISNTSHSAVKDFTLKEKSKVYARYQSPAAEPPFAAGTSEETLIVDTERGFVFDDVKTANAGFNNWNVTVIKGTEGQNYDMWSKTVTPVASPSVNNFRGQMRRLPPFVLLEALDRAATCVG
jgi:hypothetical protein